MKRRAFADAWDLPFGTMQALLQGQVRNYRSTTLSAFDGVLGRSTWDLYNQADDDEAEVAVANQAEVDELRRRLKELEQMIRGCAATPADGAGDAGGRAR